VRGRLSVWRHIGMVFQSYAIWPHMTVFDNVAYPLKLKGLPREVIAEKALNAIKTVGLTGLEKRPAPRLSAGGSPRLTLRLMGQP
jgi:iron(III) transport system ATP-binding protein